MKKLLFLIFITLIFCSVSQSQELNLAVSYLSGEKSKDSHSKEENFAVSNSAVAYSVKYKGRKSDKQEDKGKVCTFTEQDLKNIRQTIETKGLNVTDSLFQESSKTKSFEQYCNIIVDMDIDGQKYKIRINGDIKELEDKDLYKNTVFFITMLRKMVESCK